MRFTDPNGRRRYLEEIELEIPELPDEAAGRNAGQLSPRASGTEEPTAAIAASGVHSFGKNLSGQLRNDVLNSCLFSQFAANARFDKTKDRGVLVRRLLRDS